MKVKHFYSATSFSLLTCAMSALLILQSCGGEDPSDETLIDPSNANALTEVLIMPSGSQIVNGQAPAPSNSNNAPDVSASISQITSSNGSTTPLNFTYGNVSSGLGGCYVQINGASSYFNVPYSSNSGNNGSLQLPIGIPANVDQGNFSVNFCIYDGNNLISNVLTTTISVLRLGTGSLQISLSWDNGSDQDLYVTDPAGTTISYINTSSSSGGELDRDDTDGYGPENIFWNETAPDGTYNVKVNDFDFSPSTGYFVTITGPSVSRTFSGTTSNGSTANVVTFTKSGNNLSF